LHNSQQLSTEQTAWLGQSVSGARTFVQAHELFQRARRCVHHAKSRMKDRHDGKRVSELLYSIGDLVWFNIRNLGLRHDSRRQKLLPKYWGPFKVIDVVQRNAVRLDMPANLRHIHPVVSVSLIKPYVQRKNEPAPTRISGEEEHELEAITDHHVVRSKRKPALVEFKVKWLGSFESSWHEPHHFEHAQDTLVAYLQKLTKPDRVQLIKLFNTDAYTRLPATLQSQCPR
jgi:hypothetical protein